MTQHIQKLMDVAYEEWQKHPSRSYDDFLFDLPSDQKEAVLIGNLNYQVENGGFSQWILNRYGKHHESVLTVLRRIDTDAARTVSTLLEERVIPFIAWEHGEHDFDDADTAFYAVNDQLLMDVDSYLARSRA